MEEKKKIIEVSTEEEIRIAKQFDIHQLTVRNALRFNTNSPIAKMIRAYAMNHGAKLYEITTNKRELENPYKDVKIV